ncbi:hypothetical protein GCM10010372_66160 [Streptomyces tauricus]|nr:hypothetical protein GCM10010372_66160 [Streptomyces tauricus]
MPAPITTTSAVTSVSSAGHRPPGAVAIQYDSAVPGSSVGVVMHHGFPHRPKGDVGERFFP